MSRSWFALVLLAGFLLPPAPATACGPPCGPIPVVIDIQLDRTRNLTFGDANQVVLRGQVSYFVDVDRDGFSYDTSQRPVVSFKINRQPPWAEASVSPASYEVPVDDARYLKADTNNPGQLYFLWAAPVEVTIQRLRDPTQEELAAKWLRSDGTWRVSLGAASTQSITGGNLLGTSMGLQESFAVRELRFLPEGLQEGGAVKGPGGNAPGPAWGLLGGAVAAGLVLEFRRRRE